MSDLDLMVSRAKTVGGILRVYKLGQVPASPTPPYVVLALDTGTPSTYTLDSSSDSMRRLSVQCFGRVDDEVQDMARRADVAFRDVFLPEMPGTPRSSRELGTQVIRDPDAGGLLYVLHTYRFHQEG